MIGWLAGRVEAVGAEEIILNVQGVGYLLSASGQTLGRLEPGQEVSLHVETHVREDAFKLFGFLDDLERAWFVRLQEVQGVGAKAALAILDTMPVSELANAATLGDKTAFSRAKGVGPKIATRIATELKDKAPPQPRGLSIGLPPHSDGSMATPSVASSVAGDAPAREDAVSALLNLGYGESAARQAVAAVLNQAGKDADIGEVIRLSLRELAP